GPSPFRRACKTFHVLRRVEPTTGFVYDRAVINLAANFLMLVFFRDQVKWMVEFLLHEFNFFFQYVKMFWLVRSQQMTVACKAAINVFLFNDLLNSIYRIH